VTEHEGDLLLGTEVGQPVPAEQALDRDHQPVAERSERLQESTRLGEHLLV